MIKVIQTNLSIGNEGVIQDHQSLTYEVESWERFIEEVKEGVFNIKNSTMPFGRGKYERPIGNVTHDEYHMTVDYDNNQKSLFYAVGQMPKPKYK